MDDLAVIGLGYVGLPLAREAARTGLSVVGFDVSAEVVNAINEGRSHVDDVSDADVSTMLDAGFRATTDGSTLGHADTVVICVPTPLSGDGGPDLGPVRAVAQVLAHHLKRGMLVVLESTTYPGTTEEVLAPILEESGLKAGVDFNLAFSPERVDPGNATFGIRNTPKVVGGHTASCTQRVAAFYGKLIDTPNYVARRAQDILNCEGKAVKGSTILRLGVTDKPNITDQRESPAVPLTKRLAELGAILQFHDPHVTTWHADRHTFSRFSDPDDALCAADLTILLQAHSAYDFLSMAAGAKRVLDTRGVVPISSTVEPL